MTIVALGACLFRLMGPVVMLILVASLAIPTFIFGPFLLIWGMMDWRPFNRHWKKWTLLAISFAALLVLLPATVVALAWWVVNLPGVVVCWIVLSSDGRRRILTRKHA